MNGHETIVKHLLRAGVNVESEDSEYGRTPLSWASINGHEAIVKQLLEASANFESKGIGSGKTPLWWAAGKGRSNNFVWTARQMFKVGNGHDVIVKQLLEAGANFESEDSEYGQAPLWRAVQAGNAAIVKQLLKAGANAGSKDILGRTPLSWAVQRGHEAELKDTSSGRRHH